MDSERISGPGIVDGSFASKHFHGFEFGGVTTRDIFVHLAAFLIDVIDQGLNFCRCTRLHDAQIAIGLFTHHSLSLCFFKRQAPTGQGQPQHSEHQRWHITDTMSR